MNDALLEQAIEETERIAGSAPDGTADKYVQQLLNRLRRQLALPVSKREKSLVKLARNL